MGRLTKADKEAIKDAAQRVPLPDLEENLDTNAINDSIVYQGASISQLARMSGLDDRTVKDRIVGKVRPVGTRHGFNVYNVVDAAQFLQRDKTAAKLAGVDMKAFCSEFIAQMETANDLPIPIRNAYYQARLTKLEFEAKQGTLVPLELVKEVTAAALKLIRQQILLTRDRVEREIDLPPQVKLIITNELDGTISNMQDAILKEFPEPVEMSPDGVDDELLLELTLEDNRRADDDL